MNVQWSDTLLIRIYFIVIIGDAEHALSEQLQLHILALGAL